MQNRLLFVTQLYGHFLVYSAQGTIKSSFCVDMIMTSFQSMSADIYLRAYWNDSRLQYAADYLFNRSSMNRSNDTEEQPFVNLKGAYADAIWRPNIYFLDSMVENTPG